LSSIIFTTPFTDVWLTITIIDSKKKRDWKKYNEELVRRGELLFDPDFLSGWEGRRVKQIEREKGRSKVSLSKLINEYARSHPLYLLPYRQIEGFLRVFAEHIDVFKRRLADYTTVWWRVAKVKVDTDPDVDIAKDVTIAVDSTGIKVSNRVD